MRKWLSAIIVGVSLAQPVSADDRSKMLGVWRLVSYDLEFQDTGERRPVFGKKPVGYIIFTPEGRMMAYLEAENRKAPQNAEEQAAAYRTLHAYSGKYRLEGDKWSVVRTINSTQPKNGFTVAAYEDEDELETLCEAYRAGDEEARTMIRLVAELSVLSARK